MMQESLKPWALKLEEVFARMGSNPEGLTEEEAHKHLSEFRSSPIIPPLALS